MQFLLRFKFKKFKKVTGTCPPHFFVHPYVFAHIKVSLLCLHLWEYKIDSYCLNVEIKEIWTQIVQNMF